MALPTNELDLEKAREYENLELLARQVVEGFITGLHKSPYHGFSVEFAEHRLYNPGESTRYIDWKVMARTEKLFVKKYEEETNLRCQILIDSSSSMYFPDATHNKMHFSVYCAAALIYLLRKQRDAVGLKVFAEEIEKSFDARSNAVHMRHLFGELEELLKVKPKDKSTSTGEILHRVAEMIHKRSLVIIFSDMFDHTGGEEALFDALQHLKYYKHEIILFHVIDKKHEIDFEYDNRPYQFIDVETGEKVKVQPNEIRDQYKKQAAEYRQRLMLKCSQYSIDYVEADINKGFSQILLPFVTKRTKLY